MEMITTRQIPVPAAPMGWASWNSFVENIDAEVVKAQADALVDSGMAAAGYTHVNIDSGWWQGKRDGEGNIVVDGGQWPGGMAAIAEYIHGKGLKAGIYTDAGRNGCGYYYPTPGPPRAGTGSEGHYERDMLQFSRWGFDLVKVDFCGGRVEGLLQEATYRRISAAVDRAAAITGRPLALSLCEWGSGEPWNWAPGLGPMWRTGDDIIFWGQAPTMEAMLASFDKGLHPTAQHTGFYNDPDMMMVGMPGLSAAQNRTHLSLWAISGAPMLAGNDLTGMSSSTAAILSNGEAIAVGQDSCGLQGVLVAEDAPGRQVYAKVLSGDGRRAVALLNRTSSAAVMTVRWTDMGLTGGRASVRDVWAAADAGSFARGYRTEVPAGEAVLLTVTGTEATVSVHEPRASGDTFHFDSVDATAAGLAVATIAYTNGDTADRRATLQVNAQKPTVVAFPPTGPAAEPGTISVIVSLAEGANTLAFAGAPGPGPDLGAMAVTPLPGTCAVRRGSRV